MRKKVLGADYVEKSFKNANEFSSPFQELANDFAWGSVYCGGPASLDAFNFIQAALPEIEALERKAATKKQA
jgi:alkylhydroperoxidase/carboxymuconolactone decarboxylase family protein YurZ